MPTPAPQPDTEVVTGHVLASPPVQLAAPPLQLAAPPLRHLPRCSAKCAHGCPIAAVAAKVGYTPIVTGHAIAADLVV